MGRHRLFIPAVAPAQPAGSPVAVFRPAQYSQMPETLPGQVFCPVSPARILLRDASAVRNRAVLQPLCIHPDLSAAVAAAVPDLVAVFSFSRRPCHRQMPKSFPCQFFSLRHCPPPFCLFMQKQTAKRVASLAACGFIYGLLLSAAPADHCCK